MVDEVLVNAAPEACASPRDAGRLALRSTSPKEWLENTNARGPVHLLYSHQGLWPEPSGQHGLELWEDITRKKGLVPSEQLYGQIVDMLVTSNQHHQAIALSEDMKRDHASHLSSQGFALAYAMSTTGYHSVKSLHVLRSAMRCEDQGTVG